MSHLWVTCRLPKHYNDHNTSFLKITTNLRTSSIYIWIVLIESITLVPSVCQVFSWQNVVLSLYVWPAWLDQTNQFPRSSNGQSGPMPQFAKRCVNKSILNSKPKEKAFTCNTLQHNLLLKCLDIFFKLWIEQQSYLCIKNNKMQYIITQQRASLQNTVYIIGGMSFPHNK